MSGNRKVFVSHTHEDNERCVPLLAALDAWGVDYWFDTEQLDAGAELSQRIQQALSDRDVFLRICTDAATRSFWMSRELSAAQGLRADARQGNARKLISLILAPSYVSDPQEQPDTVINATSGPESEWFKQLRVALGVPATERRISRRALLGVGGGTAAAVVAASTAGTLLLTKGATPKSAAIVPTTHLPAQTPPADAARQKWFFKVAGGSDVLGSGIAGVAVSGNAVYIASAGSSDGVYALKADDGSVLWHEQSTSISSSAIPQIAGGNLYVGATGSGLNYMLAALRLADGSAVWTANTPDSIGTQPVIGGSVIYASSGKALYAFNLSDGKPLWTQPLPGGDNSYNVGAPAVSGGVVYSGAGDKQLYAFDAQSGQQLWVVPIAGGVTSGIAVVNGTVIFGTGYTVGGTTGSIQGVSATTGAPVWTVLAGDGSESVNSSPTVVDGTVYIGTNRGIVFAIDAATGKVRWQRVPQTDPTNPRDYLAEIQTQPAVSNNVVYVTANPSQFGSAVFALSATDGKQLWAHSVTQQDIGYVTAPVVVGDTVYFGATDHAVYALSAS